MTLNSVCLHYRAVLKKQKMGLDTITALWAPKKQQVDMKKVALFLSCFGMTPGGHLQPTLKA